MKSRNILMTGLVVLLCLALLPTVNGCGDKKSTTQPTATGACCMGTNCMTLTAAACAQNGGTYKGDNVACSANTCGSTTTGTITGTASLPAGLPGDITNSMVSIYTSYDDWNNYRPLRYMAGTTISAASISFTFTNVGPGTYYLDVWKDNDLTGRWSNGDFLGVYGTTAWPGMTLAPFQVIAGQSTTVPVTVIAVNWYK
jgi:uncharacterized protein (DUF2141 family)